MVVDLRQDSVTYCEWHGVNLSPSKGNALFIPEGCAHGFQVLEANSELLYLHSGFWMPDAESGIRWNDERLAIHWPQPIADISDRDSELPILGVMP